jgi:hypothetical protein
MKIPLKAVTVTYTRTLTFTPTEELFEEEPTQEAFESFACNWMFETIYEDVTGNGNPMPYTNVEQLATVEIEYEPFEIVEFDSSIFDEDTL